MGIGIGASVASEYCPVGGRWSEARRRFPTTHWSTIGATELNCRRCRRNEMLAHHRSSMTVGITRSAAWCCAVAAIAVSGCQTWAPTGFPLQNMSRVPPPGTGTYQMPNGYYNNTSAVAPNGQVMTASSNSGLRPASGALPTTNLAANSSAASGATVVNRYTESPNNSGGVQTAQFTAPTNTGGAMPASASLSDSGDTSADPALKWQP